MTMKALIEEAEKIGVKIDKKGSKQKAVEKMLAAENALKQELYDEAQKIAETESTLSIPMPVEYGENGPRLIEKPAEDEKSQKKARKQRTKKETAQDVKGLLTFIETTWKEIGIIRESKKDNVAFKALCADNGRQVIKLVWTTKKVSIVTRVEATIAHAEKWQKINYAMPFQCMFFHDTEETRQNIKDIFHLVLDVDSIRPKKEKKAKKETE